MRICVGGSPNPRDRQSMGDWRFEEIWRPKRQISSICKSSVVCMSPCRSIGNAPPRFLSGEAISNLETNLEKSAQSPVQIGQKSVENGSARRPWESTQEALNSLLTHWLGRFDRFSTIPTKIPLGGPTRDPPLAPLGQTETCSYGVTADHVEL